MAKFPGAATFVPDTLDLAELATSARECRGCDLWEPAEHVVFGAGSAGARMMLVGEQPGDQEDRRAAPFVGPAGILLNRALAQADIDREVTYVTNAVKHSSSRGGRARGASTRSRCARRSRRATRGCRRSCARSTPRWWFCWVPRRHRP